MQNISSCCANSVLIVINLFEQIEVVISRDVLASLYSVPGRAPGDRYGKVERRCFRLTFDSALRSVRAVIRRRDNDVNDTVSYVHRAYYLLHSLREVGLITKQVHG